MKVNLISYTPYALELLLYTKNTRLQGGQTLQEVVAWSEEKKLEHLAYMRDTIKSSWEFCDYVFEISGVTRAFTHQLVRTRNGRYAQESMRTVDVSGAEIKIPHIKNIPDERGAVCKGQFQDMADEAMANYQWLINEGVNPQDARGILPTNVCTSIIAQFSLRTLHEMAMVRLCTRTQGEYQNVFLKMRNAVVEVHPWAEDFIQVACVATGVCAFPRYTECPVQKWTHNRSIGSHDVVIRDVKEAWKSTSHEAIPVAKDGRTM